MAARASAAIRRRQRRQLLLLGVQLCQRLPGANWQLANEEGNYAKPKYERCGLQAVSHKVLPGC